ncbi:MAG: malto-oligosyltrehalose synthase [Pirellulales bacterium]|nr:malto-oligosyltrehalose synthase [Pirellulales bacterium]
MHDETTFALRCTYRLQLRPGFGFAEAAEIADYLEALGISHVYSSPYLQAAPGSTHGYDVLDHHSVNAQLGGTLGHEDFCMKLGKHHLGQVLDIVPNHMSVADRGNRWWWDVLENGPSSRYAAYFDVDWEPLEQKLHNLVSMPILADHYGRVLEAGEIKLEREGGSFLVRYFDHVLPLAPRSLEGILSAAAERAESEFLAFAADFATTLPLASQTDRISTARRHRDKEVLRRLLDREFQEHPQLSAAVDQVLGELNASVDELDTLLERQNYRLSLWRTAKQDLGYRRFFDINTLVGLRMEDDRVFHDTHALIAHWLERGVLDGLRIDHPDGLRDPQQYFQRLAQRSSRAWIVAEKILMPDEAIPADWPIAGTTGYDFLNCVLGLFVNPLAAEPLSEFYAEFTGEPTDFVALAREKKHMVMRDLFASDINRLTAQLADVCERHRRYRDFTRRELHSMVREVIACLPVYRTYVNADARQVTDTDRRYVENAIELAKQNRPEIDADLFDFFRGILLLETTGPLESELVMRFQQSTGPVMAKGVEDTAFYCYNRFVALNDVGGEPNRFGVSVAEFHQHNLAMLKRYPHTMLATATHDTKRGEDVRMRLAVLSEIPERWAAMVRFWSAKNDRHRVQFQPDRNAEYLYYQVLVGAWPIDAERMTAFMEKAARESKQHTDWLTPNDEYEKTLRGFVAATLGDEEFTHSVGDFTAEIIAAGRVNSLAQTLLKLTSPGIPDIYQGCELWDLNLVDPDNRRPVDYSWRRKLLCQLDELSAEQIMERAADGLPKLWLIRQTLRMRQTHGNWFNAASYAPLAAAGQRSSHVVAFVRGGMAISVVPRLPLTLGGDWGDTTLSIPAGQWQNAFTGESLSGGKLSLSDLLRRFPVALLAPQGE